MSATVSSVLEHNEMEYEGIFLSGDIVACIKFIRKLHGVNDDLSTTKFATTVGQMIQRFASAEKIHIEYAEAILASISELLDYDTNKVTVIEIFCGNEAFVTSLIHIVVNFRSEICSNTPPTHSRVNSFSSHQCYEAALFLLIALVEKSSLLKIFVKNASTKAIIDLTSSLGDIIPVDRAYITQVFLKYISCNFQLL